MRITRPALRLRRDLEGLSKQRIAREHGDAFAEDFVIGRLAPAEIIVVHRRQIVVNERIGVDALDRTGERHGGLLRSTARSGRREAERRAHAFAAGKERVAHRLVDGGGLHAFLGQETIQTAIDKGGAALEVGLEIKGRRTTSGRASGGDRHAEFVGEARERSKRKMGKRPGRAVTARPG